MCDSHVCCACRRLRLLKFSVNPNLSLTTFACDKSVSLHMIHFEETHIIFMINQNFATGFQDFEHTEQKLSELAQW